MRVQQKAKAIIIIHTLLAATPNNDLIKRYTMIRK